MWLGRASMHSSSRSRTFAVVSPGTPKFRASRPGNQESHSPPAVMLSPRKAIVMISISVRSRAGWLRGYCGGPNSRTRYRRSGVEFDYLSRPEAVCSGVRRPACLGSCENGVDSARFGDLVLDLVEVLIAALG